MSFIAVERVKIKLSLKKKQSIKMLCHYKSVKNALIRGFDWQELMKSLMSLTFFKLILSVTVIQEIISKKSVSLVLTVVLKEYSVILTTSFYGMNKKI